MRRPQGGRPYPTPALLPDDTLDPEVADQLLAKTRTRGRVAPVRLTTARTRRLRAQVRRVGDQAGDLSRSLMLPDDGDPVLAEGRKIISDQCRLHLDRAAPLVAGKDGREAQRLLKDAINDALTVISSQPPPPKRGPPDEMDLDAMSPVDLEANRTDLQATILELERGLALGHLIRVEDWTDALSERLSIFKSLLMAIPGRVAAQCEPATAEEVRALLSVEIEQALAIL